VRLDDACMIDDPRMILDWLPAPIQVSCGECGPGATIAYLHCERFFVSDIPERAERFELSILVRFQAEDRILAGLSVNVSESGMLARFDHPAEIWSEGLLSTVVEGNFIGIEARVARMHGADAGLTFHIRNEKDRQALRILLSHARARNAPAGQPPVYPSGS